VTRADALDRRFGIALAASLVVHAAALSVAPSLTKRAALDPPVTLQLSLRQADVVVPELPPAVPEVPKPAPVKRAPPVREAKVPVAPTPAPAPIPAPATPEPPAEIVERAQVEPPLAVAPFNPPVEAPPPPVIAPPAAVPREPEVPPAALLAGYGKRISDALARYKEYPRIAQLRGWEGSVTMRLRVAPSGRLIDAELHTSSGYDVLDKQAIAMATRAGQLPVPPAGLNGSEVAVLVPVVFRLER
jgi:protein TonB